MKKSLSFLLLIFIMIVVLRLAGFTYGYYATRIVNNQNPNSLSVSSKYLAVEYLDGTSIMNFDGDYLFPGDGAEKTFSVKNTGTDKVSYNILLDNVINEFVRTQDLRYDLYINNDLVTSGAINNNDIQYLYSNREIEVNGTDLIRFVFEYATTDEIQNIDMNKSISFRFNIDTNSIYSLEETNNISLIENASINNYRIYGNSIQNGTPSFNTPIAIESVGNLVTDSNSEYYGKYEIPIIIRGKNILDLSNNYSFTLQDDGSYLSNGVISTNDIVLENLKGVYTISAKIKSPVGSDYRLYVRYVDGTFQDSYKASTGEYLEYTIITNGKDIDKIYLAYNTLSDEVQFKDFQVESGEVQTEYVPYVEPITTNIYLDEPLRKIGNYADYIDFSKQVVVRQIKEKKFTGNENIKSLNTGSYPYVYYVLGDNGLVVNDAALSNYFVLQTNFSYQVAGDNVFRIYNSDTNLQSRIGFRIVDNGAVVSDVSAVKNILLSAYNNGVPFTFNYVSTEMDEIPVKLPLVNTASNLNIFEVNTIIAPSSIKLEYYD